MVVASVTKFGTPFIQSSNRTSLLLPGKSSRTSLQQCASKPTLVRRTSKPTRQTIVARVGINDKLDQKELSVVAKCTATVAASTQLVEDERAEVVAPSPPPKQRPGTVSFSLPTVPRDALQEFEAKLEADLQTVGVTLVGILGVIVFWRGVWSLLDYYIGDDVLGDFCCTIVGLGIVLYIRLSGFRMASIFPPS